MEEYKGNKLSVTNTQPNKENKLNHEINCNQNTHSNNASQGNTGNKLRKQTKENYNSGNQTHENQTK